MRRTLSFSIPQIFAKPITVNAAIKARLTVMEHLLQLHFKDIVIDEYYAQRALKKCEEIPIYRLSF